MSRTSQPSANVLSPPGEWGDDTESAPEEVRLLQAAPAQHGLRLDRFLAQQVGEFSRSYLQQLIADGLLHRNGQVCTKAATRVLAGDQYRLVLRATAQSQAFVPQAIALDVVYEDAHLLVVNKPAGLVVHPAPGNWSGTLLNALLHHYPASAALPRAGIVHRLDKDTSGLMVVARERTTFDALVSQIAARQVQREYWALAHGHWQHATGKALRVDAAIGRDPRQRLRMAVVDSTRHPGKPSQTDFTLIGSNINISTNASTAPASCWVHCKLHTGRTHQIRVHMQHLGHPLLADALYGGAAAYGMQRQALHAFSLQFQHPITRQQIQCRANLPADMQAAIAAMGLALPKSDTHTVHTAASS